MIAEVVLKLPVQEAFDAVLYLKLFLKILLEVLQLTLLVIGRVIYLFYAVS